MKMLNTPNYRFHGKDFLKLRAKDIQINYQGAFSHLSEED